LVSWFTDACFSEAVAKKIEILPAFLILAFQCKNQQANMERFIEAEKNQSV
jgi:hypothetical protein